MIVQLKMFTTVLILQYDLMKWSIWEFPAITCSNSQLIVFILFQL